MRRRVPRTCIVSLAWLCLAGSACNLDNPGDPPAAGTLYFPTAIALAPASATAAPRYLYVANSNFDLRYNSGSVQAFDLDVLDAAIAKCQADERDCATASPLDPNDRELTDPEHPLAGTALLADEVLISSYATGLTLSPAGDRVYVVTRTDSNLTFIDVDESKQGDAVLSCGPKGDRRCDAAHQRGDDSVQNGRRLRLPGEPVALLAGNAADWSAPGETPIDGDFVLVAHRQGYVSLFLDAADGPVLVDVLGNLPPEPTGIAFDPLQRRAYLSVYARLTRDNHKVLGRVGVVIDSSAPLSSKLYGLDPFIIDGVSSLERDTRAVAISSTLPNQALVVSRDPEALLWVNTAGASPASPTSPGSAAGVRGAARRTVEVGPGASRIALGEVSGTRVAVVSCFDARQIFIVEADTGTVLSVVHNLSGPFELALDSARQRLYIADFRSSVVRVVDLAPIAEGAVSGPTSAKLVATIGKPRLLEEFQ